MLNNRSAKLIYFCFLFIAIGCEQKNQVEWEDPTIFDINKEAPRAHFFSYEKPNSRISKKVGKWNS